MGSASDIYVPLSKLPALIFSCPASEWDNGVRFLSRRGLKLSVGIRGTDPRNDAVCKGHRLDRLMLLFMKTAPCPHLQDHSLSYNVFTFLF